jgi:hypothetical protein
MARLSRIKVPRRLAGVKIPKEVRKGPIMEFVNSKAGRMLIAEALTAAIGVLAIKHASPKARDEAAGKLKGTARDTRDAVARSAVRLSHAFGEAITGFRAALATPDEKLQPESAARVLAARLEEVKQRVGKKKRRSGSATEASTQH